MSHHDDFEPALPSNEDYHDYAKRVANQVGKEGKREVGLWVISALTSDYLPEIDPKLAVFFPLESAVEMYRLKQDDQHEA